VGGSVRSGIKDYITDDRCRAEVAIGPDVLADLDEMAAALAEQADQWWRAGRAAALALDSGVRTSYGDEEIREVARQIGARLRPTSA
jgi:hypothetical protein